MPENPLDLDLETVSPAEFGRSLAGLGLNILTRDVPALVSFLSNVFQMVSHRSSIDFAIMRYGNALFQIHADRTYHSHRLPEAGARGAGVEIRLYETDPDDAARRAASHGATVLQPPTNKPHGLRECVVLSDEGYGWIPSRRLTDAKLDALDGERL